MWKMIDNWKTEHSFFDRFFFSRYITGCESQYHNHDRTYAPTVNWNMPCKLLIHSLLIMHHRRKVSISRPRTPGHKRNLIFTTYIPNPSFNDTPNLFSRRLKHQGLCHQHQVNIPYSSLRYAICHSSNYNTYLCISHPISTIKIIVSSYRHARLRQRLIASMSQFELE